MNARTARLRVVFAGTPPFAARALQAIAAAGHDVALVLTQPDRPAGRGLKLAASAVSEAAAQLALPVEKPTTLKDASSVARIRDTACDVMVVAAYGLLLPQAVLDLPRRGCLNIHASLLPRWRGAAPIQRAILAGDAQTGISIMQMEAGLDTGPVLLTRIVAIDARATTGSLTEALADIGAAAIVEALARVDDLVPQPQDPALATYAAKVRKAEARIDWSRPSLEIERAIRAFDPAPGAETLLGGQPLKIWRAEVAEGHGAPGQWLRPGAEMLVACGVGAVRLLEVQRAGARRMPAGDFMRGNPMLFDAAFA